MNNIKYLRIGLLSFCIIAILTSAFLFVIIQPVKVADENLELEKARLNKEDPNYDGKLEWLKDSIEQGDLFMGWTYDDLYKLQSRMGLAEKDIYKGEFECRLEFANFFEEYLRLGSFADSIRQSLYLAERQAIKAETSFFEEWKTILKEQELRGLKRAFRAEDPIFAGKADQEVLELLKGFLEKGKEKTITAINRKLNEYDPINIEMDPDLSPIAKIKISAKQNLEALESDLIIYPKVEFVEMVTAMTLVGSSEKDPLLLLNDELKDTTPTAVDMPGPLFEKMSVLVDAGTTGNDPFRAAVELKDTATVMEMLHSSLAKGLIGRGIEFVWDDVVEIGQEGEQFLILLALNRNTESIRIRNSDVKNAFPTSMGVGFAISIEFNRKTALKWKRMTERNIDRCIAILVNNELLSWPRVNEPIANGYTSISGGFTAKEAASLAYSIADAEKSLIPLRLTRAEYEKEDVKQRRSWWSIIYILLMTSLISTLIIWGATYMISKIKEGYQ